MTRTIWASLLLISALLWAGTAMAQLAEVEQRAMSDTFQYALENNPSDKAADWVNPDTEHAGAVVPVRTFTNAQGMPCREFITTITVGGEQQQGYGTACRQPDGTWQIVSDEPPAQATKVVERPVYVYQPAERYYVYPHAYYNPYRIYFSFSWLFHNGRLHIGNYYPGVSFRYHPYYWYHRKHYKHRHYTPLPHHRWYRRDHIQRSWHHRSRPTLHRYDRKHHERQIHRHRGTIDRKIHMDRGRIERRIQMDRIRNERSIQHNRNRIERRIHPDRTRIERRSPIDRTRREQRIKSNRAKMERSRQIEREGSERSIRRHSTRQEQRSFRESQRSARRFDVNQGRRDRRINR